MQQVGVHIADVTHFVKPGTALDAEAADSCTTVYLTEKRIDMMNSHTHPILTLFKICRSHVD